MSDLVGRLFTGKVSQTHDGLIVTEPEKELILVTTHNGAYYVVEREPLPPSQQPTSYVVPFTSVEAARVGRFSDD